MPVSPFRRAAEEELVGKPDGSSLAGSEGKKKKRKSKPTTSRRAKKQKVRETYAKSREEAQLLGVIPTTPEGAVRNEVVPPSSQGAQPLSELVAQAIRKGWATRDEIKPELVDEMVKIVLDPEMSAKNKVASFNALRMADQAQYERDHPNQRGAVNVNIDASTKTVNLFDDIERDIAAITVHAKAVSRIQEDSAAQPVDAPQPIDAEAEREADRVPDANGCA